MLYCNKRISFENVAFYFNDEPPLKAKMCRCNVTESKTFGLNWLHNTKQISFGHESMCTDSKFAKTARLPRELVPKFITLQQTFLTFSSRKWITNAIIPIAAMILTAVKPINAFLRGQFMVTMHGELSSHVLHPGWHFRHWKESGLE